MTSWNNHINVGSLETLEFGKPYQQDGSMMLHPRRVTVRKGNDDIHTNEVVIDTNFDVVIKDISKQHESWGNRPRDNELDVKIEFAEEEGNHRTLIIKFHKGETFLEWIKEPSDKYVHYE